MNLMRTPSLKRGSGAPDAAFPRKFLFSLLFFLLGSGLWHSAWAATGSISATPNPIRVCDGTGKGITTLNWNSTGAVSVEVHKGSPTGTLISRTGTGPRTFKTDKWVTDGTIFYLQDVSNGLPLTAANTLATATVNLTTAGCGTLTGMPNPISVCDGSGLGQTTLNWNTAGTTATSVEVHRDSPTGTIFAFSSAGSFTQATDKSITNGTLFFLQDVTGGLPLNTENTLATVTLTTTTNGCPGVGSITATPSPIRVCDGGGLGMTTLNWFSQYTTDVEVRRNAPNGTLLAHTAPGNQTLTTGRYVTDGMTFYLQDVSGGKPLTAANTIATVTVSLTTQGCGTLTATPNPIQICDGTGLGSTTLAWNSSGTTSVEVHSGTVNGPLFATSGPGINSAPTGKTITNGSLFYLQDVSSGKPLTPENTLAVATVNTTNAGCGPTGTLLADPNPIRVCDGTGKGITTLNWNTTNVTTVEIHRNSPSGTLLSRTGSGPRTFTTGNWVTDGSTFYLQDVSGGKPLTAANTIAILTVNLTQNGCGSLTGTPNPMPVCDGTGLGQTTLNWNSTVGAVEVHRGSPSGTLFAASAGGSFSQATDKSITNGTTFYLQNVTGGLPLTAANTLASVVLNTTTTGCAPVGSITANPSPIRVCDGTGKGSTTLSWNTQFTTDVEVRKGSPSGTLISHTATGAQSTNTGKFVTDGSIYYLQDVTGGKPLTAANTLATVTVNLTTQGCGLLTVNPNPIPVCDGTGLGQTTLNWNTAGTSANAVEIHRGSPSGTLFVATGAGSYSQATDKSITTGTTFYLQDVTGGLPLTPENTLAFVTLTTTTIGCTANGSISANPNPILVCDGTGKGITTLNWTSQFTTDVEVRKGAPNGTLISHTASGAQTTTTGKTVTSGTVYYLQDVTGGKPLTAANTLSTVTVTHTTQGCGTFTGTPNPIPVCDGSGLGQMLLSWTTVGTTLVELRQDSITGKVLATSGEGSFSFDPGKTVKNNTTYYLQNASNGLPHTPQNTLGTLTVTHTTNGCTPTGTITANPGPIRVCDGSGKGITTISWNTQFVTQVEVHQNAPDGTLFSRTGPGAKSLKTGKYVTDGFTFYLQDVSGGKPLTAANTLATVTVHNTTQGCGLLTANPNPIPVCDGTGLGATTLNWDTAGTTATAVEVHKGSPGGSLIATAGAGPNSKPIGKTITNGTVFYLQDVSNGLPLASENTLGVVTVNTTQQGCTSNGTISATPNPIRVCDGTGKGSTTLNWTSQFTTDVEVRLGSPSGTLISHTATGAQSTNTGKFVTDGSTYYLQDVTGGKPLTAANTLATVTVNLTTQGCGLLTANPNPIPVCDGTGLGQTTLNWNTAGTSANAVEIHRGSPSGTLFVATGAGSYSQATDKSITNGTTYYLQDVTGGLPLTPENTLAFVTVNTTLQGCAPNGSITAGPNPIRICDGTTTGITTLNWTSQFTTDVEVRKGAPNGTLISHTAPGPQSFKTGKDVTSGTVYYLQDVSGGKPLTAANTLASVTVTQTANGCGSLIANPNPIVVCDGTLIGATTLQWSTAGTSATSVELRQDTYSGKLITTSGAGTFTFNLPKEVVNNTKYYLIDRTAGLPRSSETTIGYVNVKTTTNGCAPVGNITSTPMQVCDDSGIGSTTLNWTSQFTTSVQIWQDGLPGDPLGKLFAGGGSGPGTADTGPTVDDGSVFYLVDNTPGKPQTLISQVTANATIDGCPARGTIYGNPGLIDVCDGTGLGETTLLWKGDRTNAVEIHRDAPNGPLFASATGTPDPANHFIYSGTAPTDKSIIDGTTFYLQDVSDGRPLTPQYTIDQVKLRTKIGPCVTPSIGYCKPDLLLQYIGRASGGDGNSTNFLTVSRGMGKKAILDARDTGATFVRVGVMGTKPGSYGLVGDLQQWLTNPSAYWSMVDLMMNDLQANNLKIVPTFLWEWGQLPAMTGETTYDLITNPTSQSYFLLQQYVADYISHYKNHPQLLFYELTNELNLKADLDQINRCLDPKNPEVINKAECNPIRNVTTAQIIDFMTRFSAYVHSLDPNHQISSGYSILRKAAEHLRATPETEFIPGATLDDDVSNGDFTKDTLEQFKTNMTDMHPDPIDIVSTHSYNNYGDNERLGVVGHLDASLLPIYKSVTDELSKRLYIGEFGDDTPNIYEDRNGFYTQNVLNQIMNLRIPYSTAWVWEFYQTLPYITYDNKGTLRNLEPGYTDFIIGKIKDANAFLGNPAPAHQVPDTTPPRLIITNPLETGIVTGTVRVHAVSSDNNGVVSSVKFYLDGVQVNTLTVPPYQFDLDTTPLTVGAHRITAIATDPIGNATTYRVNIKK